MAKISIIITTRDRVKLLEEAMKSVSQQTYSNWEMIVVDDGSTDSTREVVARYAEKEPRVRYLYQDHQGLPFARLAGLKASTGEYVCFLDDDDTVYPEKFSLQLNYLLENPSVGLVYSYVDMVNDTDGAHRLWPDKPATDFIELIRQCTIQPNSLMIRKACFDQVGSFNTGLIGSEDYEMWLRVAKEFKIAFMPVTTGLYRVHDHNLSHLKLRRLYNMLTVYRTLFAMDLSEEERAEVVRSAMYLSYWPAMEAYKNGKYREAAQLYLMSIYFHPAIGKWTTWGKINHPIYKIMKPYLAVAYSYVRGLVNKQKSEVYNSDFGVHAVKKDEPELEVQARS